MKVLEGSGIGFVVADHAGTIRAANSAASEIFGLASAEDLCGSNIFEFTPADRRADARVRFQNLLDRLFLSVTYFAKALRVDGEIAEVLVSQAVVDLAEGSFILYSAAPTSFRGSACREDSVPLVVTDHDWRISYVSRSAESITDSEERLRGSGLLGLVHPEDAMHFLDALSHIDGDGTAVSALVRIHAADAWVPMEVLVARLCRHTPPRLLCSMRIPQPWTSEDTRVAPGGARSLLEAEQGVRRLGSQLALAVSRGEDQRKLTGRQCEIIARSIRGQVSTEIARAMYLSPGTVRNALSDLYRRYSVHSQLGLVTLFLGGTEIPEGKADNDLDGDSDGDPGD